MHIVWWKSEIVMFAKLEVESVFTTVPAPPKKSANGKYLENNER